MLLEEVIFLPPVIFVQTQLAFSMDDDYYEYNYDELARPFTNHHNLDDGWIENSRSLDAHHDANSYIRFLKPK